MKIGIISTNHPMYGKHHNQEARRKIQVKKTELKKKYVEERKSISQIASELGYSYYNIWYLLQKYGIPKRPRRISIPEECLRRMYSTEQKSITEIAKHFHCNSVTIYKRLKEFCIQIERSQRLSKALKGRHFSKTHRKNISLNHADITGNKNPFYGKHHNAKTRKILSAIAKKRFSIKKNHPFYGKTIKAEVRRKISDSVKKLWMNTQYRVQQIPKIVKIFLPTKPEIKFQKICETHNIPFVYTGNRFNSRIGLVPDFTHKTQKVVVEIFGRRWHPPEDAFKRISAFSLKGLKCIVFWEDQVKEHNVLRVLTNEGVIN